MTTILITENNNIIKRPRGRPKKQADISNKADKPKRPRGRPRKYFTDEERAEANRQGYKKCMENPNNRAIRNARYKAWAEKNRVELLARRKAVRDRKKAEREIERLKILQEVKDILN